MNGLKGVLAAGEIMFYPLYLFPAFLCYLLAVLPALALANVGIKLPGVDGVADGFISILDPTDNLR